MDYQKLCINCMREKPDAAGACPFCGFDARSGAVNPQGGLSPHTILRGKYLIGTEKPPGRPNVNDFGITYIAMDLVMERIVSVREFYSRKFMRRSHRYPEKAAILEGMEQYKGLCYENQKNFVRMAQALAQQGDMAGIARVYDFFDENWTSYMIQEYVSEVTLFDYLKMKGRMSAADAVRLLLPVAGSVQALNQAGVLHCSIWPGSIRVLPDGTAKLTDFQNIRTYGPGPGPGQQGYDEVRDQVWRRIGEPCSPAGDAYGIAASLCCCVCGGTAPDWGRVLREVQEGRRTLAQAGAAVSPGVEAVLKRGIARDRGARFQSVQELLDNLGRQLQEDRKRGGAGPFGGGKRKALIAVGACAAAAAVFVGGLAVWHLTRDDGDDVVIVDGGSDGDSSGGSPWSSSTWEGGGSSGSGDTDSGSSGSGGAGADSGSSGSGGAGADGGSSGSGGAGTDGGSPGSGGPDEGGTSVVSSRPEMAGWAPDHTCSAEDTYTVMVYMVGSNLESNNGAASADILEMEKSGLDFSNNHVLVYTGGSKAWELDGIPSDRNVVFEVGTDSLTEAGSTSSAENMGSAETFADFLNYSYENYPADHYALICWDHGNGPIGGFGNDQLYDYDALLMSEMREALRLSPFGPDNRLDWIGFDACLMATVELADLWDDYAYYMIASQETEPGYGWNYDFLSALNGERDPEEIGKRIVDSYRDFYSAAINEYFHPELTLSCMDLSKAGKTLDALDALLMRMNQGLDGGAFSMLAKNRDTYKRYGLTATGSKDDSLDLIDLGSMADRLEEEYPSEARELQERIHQLVVYGVANVSESSGISMYYPYDNRSEFQENGQYEYENISDSQVYRSFVKKFSDIWLYATLDVDWAMEDIKNGRKEITVKLTDEQLENTSSAYYTVMQVTGKNLYTPVKSGCLTEPDKKGKLHVEKDQRLFYVDTEDTSVAWPVEQAEMYDDVSVYTTEGILVFSDLAEALGLGSSQSVIVSVAADEDGKDDPYILDVRMEDEQEDALHNGRNEISLQDWTNFGWSFGRYKPVYGKKGELLPCGQWEEDDEGVTGSVPIDSQFDIYYRSFQSDSEDYVCQIILKDTVGQYHASELIEM